MAQRSAEHFLCNVVLPLGCALKQLPLSNLEAQPSSTVNTWDKGGYSKVKDVKDRKEQEKKTEAAKEKPSSVAKHTARHHAVARQFCIKSSH